jgi:hypothetical protein
VEQPVTAPESAGPAKSLPARIIGVFTSPRATYADVAAHPRALGVLLFVLVVGAAGLFVFLSTDVGKQAMLDQQMRTLESFGIKIPDAAYQQMEARADSARYTGAIGQAVGVSLVALVIAGIAFVVFNAIMGGAATFKQAFAVVAHSGVIICLSQLFNLPLGYARESLSGATNLAVFFPFLDDNSFAARALGSVDLFILWWIVSLSIGLGVLYKRRTQPIATTLIIIYVVIGLVIAAVKSAVAGA